MSFTQQHSFSKEELIACGHGELFGPENAQLPTGTMLMVDRVTHISSDSGLHGKGQVTAELDIHPDLWLSLIHI